jgi:hypothetical protein
MSLKDLIESVFERINETNDSIRTACKYVAEKHSINEESLRKAVSRNKKSKNRSHGNQRFSDQTENQLCALILAFSSSGLALTRSLFLSFVRKAIVKDDNWGGDCWLDLFTKRHEDLIASAFGKPLDEGRVKGVSSNIVDQFLVSYERLQEIYSFSADCTINADESPCKLPNKEFRKILRSAKGLKQSSTSLPKSTLRTILPFVAASGKVWLVVLIYTVDKKSQDEISTEVAVRMQRRLTRSTFPTYYAVTANGYI